MSETEATYAPARERWTGVIGQFQTRERIWMGVAAACAAVCVASEWRHSMQLASVKTAQGAPRVLQANCDGTVSEAKLVPASEYTPADGLVFTRLETVVRCMRGLKGTTQDVAECWDGIRMHFRGKEASKRFEADSARLLGKSHADLQWKIDNEPVRVERADGRVKTVGGGYSLRWQEIGKREGKLIDETWGGVFTVELTNPDDDSGGMRIVDYAWEKAE